MSEDQPNYEYEVKWESDNGTLRSETIPGDSKFAQSDPYHLYIEYDDRDEPHFEVVGHPFIVRRV